jgi:hypothetical protein
MKPVLVLSMCIFVPIIACGGSNPGNENQEILDSLDEPPGSQMIRFESVAYYDCPESPARRKVGEVLRAYYRPSPSLTAQAIVEFYILQLGRDWQHRREDVLFTAPLFPGEDSQQQGTMPVVRFEQGAATIYVQGEDINTLELDREHGAQAVPSQFTLIIDSRGAIPRPSCD